MTENLLVAQGAYSRVKRFGDLIFTAGITPRASGELVATGLVRSDLPIEHYTEIVTLAAANALAAARSALEVDEDIATLLSLVVYIACDSEFTAHSAIADLASRYLVAELQGAGECARTAVGVSSLPGGAPIEMQLTAAARRAPSVLKQSS